LHSQFINDVIGRDDMKTSDSLESVTTEMSYATTKLDHKGVCHDIALVDTVGWAGSDARLSSKDVLLKDAVVKLTSS
jgi:hypothetical protein